MALMPFPDVPIVTGTKLECKLAGCFEHAVSRDGLCRAHATRRFAYTAVQLGGLTSLTIAAFMATLVLGYVALGLSLVLIGLALER